MSDQLDSSDLLVSCTTTLSVPSVNNRAENPSDGYDADDEADLLSHVSETSSFVGGDSDAETDVVSSPDVTDEVLMASPDIGGRLVDSAPNYSLQPTEPATDATSLPPEPLAEGDSGSSTSSPVRTDDNESAGPSNLRRRRVHVESESAKRARMEL